MGGWTVKPLTKREEDVLRWLSEGLTQKQIAAKKFRAYKTVSGQARRAKEKLGAKTVLHAAVLWAVHAQPPMGKTSV